jgi:predicted nucleic acid-binding protein
MIVLDSSFLIGYHNTRDTHHAEAARTMVHLAAGEWGPALLLEYVFLEVVTVLRARRGQAVALTVAEQLLNAREVEFLPCSDFFTESLRTLARESAALSFTDAAILTVARRERGVIATFDADLRGLPGVTVVPG